MILSALELVRQQMNESFGGDVVILSNIANHDGTSYAGADNKVVMFLANIQHETTISTYQPSVPVDNDNRFVTVAPPLYINLFVLFFANFYDQNYAEGVGMISRVISFFQQNPSFNHQKLPSLSPEIGKLAFEMTNLDVTDLNYLMALSGTKYLPSVYYKVRMIPFSGEAMQAEVPVARGVKAAGQLEGEPDPDAGSSASATDADAGQPASDPNRSEAQPDAGPDPRRGTGQP